jgi:hypothetical protein
MEYREGKSTTDRANDARNSLLTNSRLLEELADAASRLGLGMSKELRLISLYMASDTAQLYQAFIDEIHRSVRVDRENSENVLSAVLAGTELAKRE